MIQLQIDLLTGYTPQNLESCMNQLLKNLPSPTSLGIAAILLFFMLLTRGSHTLSIVALPDASLAIFLVAGIYLARLSWFALFFVIATLIDFGAAALDPVQGFCLTNGYWGLIPAYGVMWLGGMWLAKQGDAFKLLPYTIISALTTLLAFTISTQTYYLFSNRFPNSGLGETLQHGWNYLPGYFGFTAMYFTIIYIVVRIARNLNLRTTIKA